MGFKRISHLENYPTGSELTKMLTGIGIKIGNNDYIKNVNIEDTLISGVIEGVSGDYRVLSLITNWIEIHHEIVNADRLFRAVSVINEKKVKAYFANLSFIMAKDPRFKKFRSIYKGERQLLGLTDDYSYLVKKHGEDERFSNGKLIVANYTLRNRKEDVMSIQEMAKFHRVYYYRLLIGPVYRADMIGYLTLRSELSASELAKATYGSFATAWEVLKTFNLLNLKAG